MRSPLERVGLEFIDTCAPVFTLLPRGAIPPQSDKLFGDEAVHDAVTYEQNRAFLCKGNKYLSGGLGTGFCDLN